MPPKVVVVAPKEGGNNQKQNSATKKEHGKGGLNKPGTTNRPKSPNAPKSPKSSAASSVSGSGKSAKSTKKPKDDLWQEAYSALAADSKGKKLLKKLGEIMRDQQQKNGKPVSKLRSEVGRQQMLALVKKRAVDFESKRGSQTIGKVCDVMLSLKDIIASGAAATSPFATIAVAGLFMVFETQVIYSSEKRAMFDTAAAIANAIVRHAKHEQTTKIAHGDDRDMRDLRRQLYLNYKILYENAYRALARLVTVLYSDWAALKLILKLDNWSEQHAAIKNADRECIDFRNEIRLRQEDKKPSGFSFCSRNSLHHAASLGYAEQVFQYINNNDYDVNERTKDEYTALMLAASHGHLKIVRTLLTAKGIKVDLRNKFGTTALHLATSGNHVGVVKVLLEKGASISIRNNKDRTPFLLAATFGKPEVLKALKGAGQDMNERTINLGFTGLHLAAENGRVATVKYLIENGADRDLKVMKGPDVGKTAKDLAEKKGKEKVVELL